MAETELIDKDNDLLHSTIANVKPMDRTGGQAESTDMQDKFIDKIVQHFKFPLHEAEVAVCHEG